MLDHVVRRIDLPQRRALVALLPAGWFAGRLAQTACARLPLRLVQSIAGRRLAAIGTVQPKPTLQLRHPRQQHGNGFLEHRVLGPKAPKIVQTRHRDGSSIRSAGGTGSIFDQSHGQGDSYGESRGNRFFGAAYLGSYEF